MNPTEYKPTTAEDFIGPARAIARTLDQIIARALPTGAPIKVLLHGDPGVGKSALVDYLLARLRVEKWSISKISGTAFRLDDVEAWAKTLCYRELGGSYKVMRIEEMDRASHTARAGMLTVLDDLPPFVSVICTCNKKLDDIEPRFLSRFQRFEVKPPTGEEIRELLQQFELRPDDVNRISEFCCGNVRLALFEAQTAIDELASLGTLQLFNAEAA